MGNVFGECLTHCTLKTKLCIPTQISMLFQLQSKIVEPVDPSLTSFLYSVFFNIIELVFVLNIAVILLAGRQSISNKKSFDQSIKSSHFFHVKHSDKKN